MRKSILHRQKKLSEYFLKAGFEKHSISKIHKNLFFASLIGILIFMGALFFVKYGAYPIRYYLGVSILLLTFGLLVLFFIFAALFYAYIDMIIFIRKKEMEKFLPEFLLLTSSNMKAGMLIDQALLYASKPKYGTLGKEMEMTMKDVLVGKDLIEALNEFTLKFDSVLLKRSFDILIEGVESGGKMANILNKISLNLSELALQKKEMDASVTTYAIFISFATICVAPILMALSGQILEVIRDLMGTLSESGIGESGTAAAFMKFSPPTLTQGDFMIFSIVMLSVSSLFSAVMVSVIKKGNIKQGLKYIPAFIITSIIIYLIANYAMKSLFGSIF